jgi:hypothetical protein
MSKLFVMTMLAIVTVVPGSAQNALPNPGDNMQAMLAASQASAVRPGDEAMNCDALHSELLAQAKSPAMPADVQKSGPPAVKDLTRPDELKSAIAAQRAAAILSSIPPAGTANIAAAQAQIAARGALSAQNLQPSAQQMQDMMTLMPAMMPSTMRSLRVIQLAQNRKCEWIVPPASIAAPLIVPKEQKTKQ